MEVTRSVKNALFTENYNGRELLEAVVAMLEVQRVSIFDQAETCDKTIVHSRR